MSLEESCGPPEVRMFWTGPPLSPYELLSLQSFIAAGARVLLYASNKALQVPDGVELLDVRELLPGPVHRFYFPDGDPSPALHSNLVRYAAIHRFGGWYADLDMICLRSLPTDEIYLAWQSDTLVNAAVMKFPARSPVLAGMIGEARGLLPQTKRGAPGSSRGLLGPPLVTKVVHDYALDDVLRPVSSAYAIQPFETPAMFDPRRRDELDERIIDSDFAHLWNEYLRRVRIPKDLGPPKGSFLDGLFVRFGFSFDDEARLSTDAVAAWFEESIFLVQTRARLQARYVPSNALEILMGVPRSQTGEVNSAGIHEASVDSIPAQNVFKQQTVRAFWAGGEISPYQVLALRSFADRGHRVEVFTYDSASKTPSWIKWCNADDVIPAERIIRGLSEPGQSAIHASLFRHALLHRYGGWWVEPDVLLLGAELPDAEIFFARSHDTRLVSPAVMKFPQGHATLGEVLFCSASLDDKPEQWDQAGDALLARGIAADGLLDQCRPPELVSPIAWFDVEMLFDPARADMLEEKFKGGLFLDLHQDAWLRAGVPRKLGPPLGSYLDRLFKRHEVGWPFAARIEYGDLRRWFAHMSKTYIDSERPKVKADGQ